MEVTCIIMTFHAVFNYFISIFFFYTETQIINEALKFKRKI